MKKKNVISILIGLILLPYIGFCQNQAPTGAMNAAVGYTDWYRGGNNGIGSSPNKIGTFWNSPMYFYTNGSNFNDNNLRMKINPTFTAGGGTNQYSINGYGWASGVNTSGYVGIGENNSNLWSTKGPFSMLHLNGNNYMGFAQEFGYRPWMKS